jgi:hypothetical protein
VQGEGHAVKALAFSPDGTMLAVAAGYFVFTAFATSHGLLAARSIALILLRLSHLTPLPSSSHVWHSMHNQAFLALSVQPAVCCVC